MYFGRLRRGTIADSADVPWHQLDTDVKCWRLHRHLHMFCAGEIAGFCKRIVSTPRHTGKLGQNDPILIGFGHDEIDMKSHENLRFCWIGPTSNMTLIGTENEVFGWYGYWGPVVPHMGSVFGRVRLSADE